jgi:peptidoglycan/LPS O-acetylase OafA/YrhL
MMQFLPFLLVGTAFHYYHRGRLRVLHLMALQAGLLLAFVWSWRLGLMSADGWSGPLSYLIAYAVFSIAFALRHPIDSLPRPLSWPLSGLAEISYPLYVVHGILGYSLIAALLTIGFGRAAAIAVAIAVALAMAVVIHMMVERPTRALGRSLAAAAGKGKAAEI